MAKDRPEPEEGPGGAPKWMVTFSDCMTLLLTFFVLLLSFSSFDDKAYRKFITVLATGSSSISGAATRNRDSLMQRYEMEDRYQKNRDKGSESPTLNPQEDGYAQEDPGEFGFRNRKVYLTPSSTVFLGSGATLSRDGRKLLADLATILQTLPNKIVISENSLRASSQDPDLGLKRAWNALTYLVVQGKLAKDRFAISGTSTVPYERLTPRLRASSTGRLFEITLLDQNVCR